jgi:acetyl esterase/lipase
LIVAFFLFIGFFVLRNVSFSAKNVLGLQSGTRYKDEVFTDVDITTDVQYGSAIPYKATSAIPLLLDMYQPRGDTIDKRPVVILVHGGGFIRGSKENWKNTHAKNLARRGYVVLAINYRLMTNFEYHINAPLLPIAINQAREDALAAVRWARANATTYKLDPSKVAIGGYSAGAFTAYYAAYDTDAVGTSGSPGQSSIVTAAYGIAGAILTNDLEKIEKGEPPLLIIHGLIDLIVPVSFIKAAEPKLLAHSIPYQAFYYPNTGHEVIDKPTVLPQIVNFLYTYVIQAQTTVTPPITTTIPPVTTTIPPVTTTVPPNTTTPPATSPPSTSTPPTNTATTSITHTPSDTGFENDPLLYIGTILYAIGVISFMGARVVGTRIRTQRK